MTFSVRSPRPLAESARAIDWEEVPCLLCGSDQWSPLLEAPDPLPGEAGLWFAVVKCRDCGLCYTNPRPNPQSMGQFYPSSYAPHQPKERGKARPWFRRLLHRGTADWRKHLPRHGAGRLLDFGCGGGSFLVRMHQQGWDVTGLDMSPLAVQHVRQRCGLRALTGSLPHADLAPASFDTITMWHSLEHVHQPLAVLREAHCLLVAGGQLLVSVPNIDSMPFRWFGRHWFGLDLPRHLTHFTPWTLRLMLHRAGFFTRALHMERHGSWLASSAQLANRQPCPTRWQRCLGQRPIAKLASWLAHLTRRGDCITAVAVKR